ncbi:MAG: type II toxin-antitoxin system prevent-host-death family antitoxin [Ilumatobacter sp.]|nr:type II toxin-antitoxin system prevent-host-death family antitoxin [Ilumatobacter sp.]
MKRAKYTIHNWAELHGPITEALKTKNIYEVAAEFGIKYNTLKDYVWKNQIKVHVVKLRARHRKNTCLSDSERVEISLSEVATKVSASEFRRETGKFLQAAYDDGILIITNERWGDFVVMTADEYNYLKRRESRG